MNIIPHTHQALCACVLLLLAGCTADGGTAGTEGTDGTRRPVHLAMTLGQSGGTRAADATTLDGVWPAGTCVTIAISGGTGQYDYKTGDDSSLQGAGQAVTLLPAVTGELFYWTVDDPKWKFIGWYPAGTTATTAMEVAGDQRVYTEPEGGGEAYGITEEDYRAYDLLYCPPTEAVHAGWAGATLTFYHQLARIFVKVNASLTDGERVTDVAFGGSTDATGKLGLKGHITGQPTAAGNGNTTWAIDGGQTASISHMRYRSELSDPDNDNYVYECLLPPQQSAAAVDLITIYTSGSDEGDREYVYSKAFNFKSGHQYTYDLNISQQGVISLTSLQVTDWLPGDPFGNTAVIPDRSY